MGATKIPFVSGRGTKNIFEQSAILLTYPDDLKLMTMCLLFSKVKAFMCSSYLYNQSQIFYYETYCNWLFYSFFFAKIEIFSGKSVFS